MADAKITALTAYSTYAATDVLAVVDLDDTTMDASGTTKKMTISQIKLATGTAVTGGGAGRLLYEDASQNLAASSVMTFDGNAIQFQFTAGYALNVIGISKFYGNYNVTTTANPAFLCDTYSYGATNSIPFIIRTPAATTPAMLWLCKNSSTSTARPCGYIDATFNTSTDASWTGNLYLYAGDYTSTNAGMRLGVQVQSDGTQAKLGFYGQTPAAKAATPTTLADVITILQNLGLCS